MGSDETIRLSRAFCSARDRNVPVLRDEAGSAHSSGTARDAGAHSTASLRSDDLPRLVSCLDSGVRCTGWLCPLFTLPTLPPEELLAEAVQAERDRKTRAVTEGFAILERALSEGRFRRRELGGGCWPLRRNLAFLAKGHVRCGTRRFAGWNMAEGGSFCGENRTA